MIMISYFSSVCQLIFVSLYSLLIESDEDTRVITILHPSSLFLLQFQLPQSFHLYFILHHFDSNFQSS